jgi:hypothetical protein
VVFGLIFARSAQAQYTTATLTDANRQYDNVMDGGWGSHLRAPMRNQNGDLFFAVDQGPDVNHNTSINYFKKTTTGWQQIGSLTLPAGIQQNMAHIMAGNRYIYSYGVAMMQAPFYV